MEQQITVPKSSPRDVFMYLFATAMLYFSAFSVIWLLLSYVDILLPDPLKERYGGPESSIRWFLAMLVVIFPAYLWASRFLRRDIAKEPVKAEIRVRKWLLYLTIFLAALLAIGDLVGLIYNFLEGDLTTQFMLKIVAVLVVAAIIFWYYLTDLRTKGAAFEPRVKGVVYGAIALVAVVAVTGFALAGSPFRQRLVRFDEQKISDLQDIQWQVINYWQKKEVLPPAIGALRDDIAGYVPPQDPQSGTAYEYRATGERSFELCAEFNMVSDDDRYNFRYTTPMGSESWKHPAGRNCFARTIDPELYPPYSKQVGKPASPVPVKNQ